MGLKKFLTFGKLKRGGQVKDDDEESGSKKKKKKRSIRDIKYVRHGQHEMKRRIMDEALDI